MKNEVSELYHSYNPRALLIALLVCMVVLSLYFITYDYYGTRIEVNDGYGFDGIIYASFARSPISTLTGETQVNGIVKPHLQISDYHIQRLLPSSLIYLFSRTLGVRLDQEPAELTVKYFFYYNILMIIASMYIFYIICKIKKYNYLIFLLGIIFLFVNFSTLKMMPYYSTLTDISAVFCSLLAIYAYIKNSRFLLAISLIITYWTWPFGTIFIGLLFLFPAGDKDIDDYEKIYSVKINGLTVSIFAILLYIPLFIYYQIGSLTTITLLALLIYIIFISIFMSSLKYPGIRSLISNISIINIFYIIVLFVGNVILKNALVSTYSLPEQNILSYFILNILIRNPGSYPLLFFIQSFLYFGPAMMLFLMSANRFSKDKINLPLGIFTGICIAVVMLGGTEARLEIFAYPFIVYVICLTLSKSKLSLMHLIALLIISIIAVRFHIIMPITPDPNNQLLYPSVLYFENFYNVGLTQFVKRFMWTFLLSFATFSVYTWLFQINLIREVRKIATKFL